MLPAANCSRKTGLNKPLFPGYLFVNQSTNNRVDLKYIPGSCGMIVFNGRPATINSEKIDQIRMLSDSGLEIQRHEQIYEGERVLIINGPLTGIEGEFIRLMNSSRLIVNILTLNQSVSVEIKRDSIKRINKKQPYPSEETASIFPQSNAPIQGSAMTAFTRG
jgi:transcription antitermination factor NusG